MRPSPARVEAPEPDVWLPILDITGELEALDITAELEELDLETSRADFTSTLTALEQAFWSTAPRGLEEAVARITYVEPPKPPEPARVEVPIAPAPDEPAAPAALAAAAEPEVEPDARVGLRHRIGLAATEVDVRTRVVGTVLVVALLAALATVSPSVVGASVPQRDVTLTLDGTTVARTVRLESVADVLALEGIRVRAGDRVVPAPRTELREGMHIEVLRAFPVDVEVDGTVTTVRTTAPSVGALRRELGVAPALIARASVPLSAGTAIAFRTPHHVKLEVDGRTIDSPRSTALDVAGLLAENRVPLGARDEVMPAPSTRLSDGLHVEVLRLADDQVADRIAVPFTTELRDDPNLQVGQTRTIQPGVPGLRRDLFHIITRADGTVATKEPIGSELLVPPVAQVIVKGTQPIPPRATGSATWYGTAPGRGTCAHLSLPFGTIVTLTNLATGAVAQCRVADRGPEAWTGHVIDLAPDVFRHLAPLSQGVIGRIGLSWR
ncbi:MAG: ubiquitin-like domain-containing protein [Acidimicrobiia bacterium]